MKIMEQRVDRIKLITARFVLIVDRIRDCIAVRRVLLSTGLWMVILWLLVISMYLINSVEFSRHVACFILKLKSHPLICIEWLQTHTLGFVDHLDANSLCGSFAYEFIRSVEHKQRTIMN